MRDLKFVERIAYEFLEGKEEERASGHSPCLRLLERALDVLDGLFKRFVRARCVALRFVTKLFQTGDEIVL